MKKFWIILLLVVMIAGCVSALRVPVQNDRIAQASVRLSVIKNDGMGTYASGVYITDDGYIATARHVVKDANSIQVMNNGNVITADSWTWLPDQDAGLIKVDITTVPAQVGEDTTRSGTKLYCVSNELLLEGDRVSKGTLLSYGLVMPGFGKVMLMNMQAIPGMSGSGVYNEDGELVGIAVAYSTARPELSIATPISKIIELLEQTRGKEK